MMLENRAGSSNTFMLPDDRADQAGSPVSSQAASASSTPSVMTIVSDPAASTTGANPPLVGPSPQRSTLPFSVGLIRQIPITSPAAFWTGATRQGAVPASQG